MACILHYIPPRLLPNGRVNHHNFSLGERLYRRCKKEEIENPFDTISLYDLSLNRSGVDNEYSVREDVLLNTRPSSPEDPQRFAMEIAELLIQELSEINEYDVSFSGRRATNEMEGDEVMLNILLRHKLEDCNYSHCAFEFRLDGIEVTSENYSQTLGHKNSGIGKLRLRCRQEIAKMILKGLLRVHW